MGRITQPCNLTQSEQDAAWDEFDGILTPEEEEAVTECMDHYLFYTTERRGEIRECICTHYDCGRFVMSRKENPEFWLYKHGRKGTCPSCGKPVQLIALGKMHSFRKLNDEKWKRVTICRTGKNGALLLMSAYVKRYFCHEDLRPLPEMSWKAMTYLLPGKRMQWFRLPIYGCGSCWGYQWIKNDAVKEPFQPSFYGEGGDSFFIGTDAIGRSALRFCQVDAWYWNESGIAMELENDELRNVVKYLSAYTQYPSLEMAVKLGLHRAATDLVCLGRKNNAAINWQATNMQNFLRLNKQDAKAFFHAEADLDVLAAYHAAKRVNAVGNMSEYISLLNDAGIIGLAGELTGCAKAVGCSIRTAINYTCKNGNERGRVLTTWRDYLSMAKQLGFDMTRADVTMPKDLQDRHDAAAETLTYHRMVEEQKKNKEFNKRLRKMYEFTYGDLCIVVPGSTEEIIMEGKTLKHCVGGYAARHFNDKTTILFLRHKRRPNRPFVTIEIIPRSTMKENVLIRQIHGYRNEGYLIGLTEDQKLPKRPEKKYKWFLDIWKAWVKAGSKRDKQGKPIFPEREEKTA